MERGYKIGEPDICVNWYWDPCNAITLEIWIDLFSHKYDSD